MSICAYEYLHTVCFLCVSKYAMWCVIHMWVRVWCSMSSVCEHVHMTWYVMHINTCAWFACMYVSGLVYLWPVVVSIPSLLYSLIFRQISYRLHNTTSHYLCLRGATVSADWSDQNPDMSAGLPSIKLPSNAAESGAHNSIWLPGSVSWMPPNPSPNFCFLTFINYVCMYAHAYI